MRPSTSSTIQSCHLLVFHVSFRRSFVEVIPNYLIVGYPSCRYVPQPPQASATICTPQFELWDVTASVDIRTSNLTSVQQLRPFTSSSNFSSLAANLTGPPLNGRAYNGIQFNLSNPDEFVLRRQEALQLQLPAAIFQAAVMSPEGIIGSFDADKFVNLATRVYVSCSFFFSRLGVLIDSADDLPVARGPCRVLLAAH